MGLFDYLVTSQTRQKLLQLLWGEGVDASIHQIAKLSGLAYSAVYKELEQMKKEGLVTSQLHGRAEFLRKNITFIDGELLMQLIGGSRDTLKRRTVNEGDIRDNLARLGAPLGAAGTSKTELTTEEVAVHALVLARRDATVARSLPLFFAKNANELNYNKLIFLATQMNLKPMLGFFLDLTGYLSGNKKLTKLAHKLYDKRRKKDSFFFLKAKMTPLQRQLSELNTPRVARKWHFLMNMGMDSFETLFQKNYEGVKQ